MWPLDVRQHPQWNQNTAIWAIKCENLVTINVAKTVMLESFKYLHKQSVKIVLDIRGANAMLNSNLKEHK